MTVTDPGQDWALMELVFGIITLGVVALHVVDPFTYLAKMVSKNGDGIRDNLSQGSIVTHMLVLALVLFILGVVAYSIQAYQFLNNYGPRANYSRDYNVMAIVIPSAVVLFSMMVSKYQYNETRDRNRRFLEHSQYFAGGRVVYGITYVALLVVLIAPAWILYTEGSGMSGVPPVQKVYQMHAAASTLTAVAVLISLLNFQYATKRVAEVDAELKVNAIKIDKTVKPEALRLHLKGDSFKLPATGSIDHPADVVNSVELKYASKVARDYGQRLGITPENLSVIENSEGVPHIADPVTASKIHDIIRPIAGSLLNDPFLKHSDFAEQFKGTHFDVGAPMTTLFMKSLYMSPFTSYIFQDLVMGVGDGLGIAVPFYSSLSFLIALNVLANGVLMTHSAAAGFFIFFVTGLGSLYYGYAGHTAHYLELYFLFQFFGWAIMYGGQFIGATGLYVFRGWTNNEPTICYGCSTCVTEDTCPDLYFMAAFYLSLSLAFVTAMIIGLLSVVGRSTAREVVRRARSMAP